MFRLVDKTAGYLFASRDLRELLEQRLAAVRHEVENLDTNRLLNTSPTDLAEYLVEKYSLEVPTLRRQDWSAAECESRVDVSQEPNRWIRDRHRPFYIPGQRIEIEVPFDGEPELFYACASQGTLNPPRAIVRHHVLILVYEMVHDIQRDLRPEIDRTLDTIDQHITWVRRDVDEFNRSLPANAQQAIEQRRQRLLANQGRVAALGIPLKVRSNTPQTYAVPTVRRKLTPTLPPATSAAYLPEPVLDTEHYEHILMVIQNMAQVMERSPSAFSSMGEEDLRQHFLVQLNGQFEGNATGETFNVGGKTDIFLRENGRNIFIAECKFWKGPKHFRETIDQLLGYTAWRDTKTAILVFNRGTEMTTVLQGVNIVAEEHAHYKRTVDWRHESGFRYVFHHQEDKNREFLLTVLVFDIPIKIA
jgi:hypothetical protein